MAKIKLSAIVSEMRGKLNGSVFSKNRGGAYIRTKVTPVNPSTSAQAIVRAQLSSFAQNWRNLTQAQILAWNSAVASWAKTDIFGDIKNPTGINLYIRLNMNLANIGYPAIANPPLPAETGIITDMVVTAVESLGTISMTTPTNTTTVAQTVVTEATGLLSPGVSFAKSKFRKINTFAGGGAGPESLDVAWANKYGSLVAGQKIIFRVKAIDLATGTSGQYTYVETIVVP